MKGKIFCLLFAGLICCVVAQRKMKIVDLKMEWECSLNAIIAHAKFKKLENQANCLDEHEEFEGSTGNESIKKICEIYDGEKELRVLNYTTKLILDYANREPRPCFTNGSYEGFCKEVSATLKEWMVNQTITCETITRNFMPIICGAKKRVLKRRGHPRGRGTSNIRPSISNFCTAKATNKLGEFLHHFNNQFWFSCPGFNAKINPTLYQVKEGDHFDEKLLTKEFDCASVRRDRE